MAEPRHPRATMLLALLALLSGAACRAAPPLPLAPVKDIPLGAPTRRFDYVSLDGKRGLLFVADLAGSRVLAIDVRAGRRVATIGDIAHVHGVLAAPDEGRVYASATGAGELVTIEEQTLAVIARSPAGRAPDGIAWDFRDRKLYVSDETGGAVAVIAAAGGRPPRLIPMGGEVGNTKYDPRSGLVYSNAEGRDELVAIDPRTDRIVWRRALAGCAGPHGLLIDAPRRLAFVACEDNARLIELSLASGARLAEARVGAGPDVLAFDPGLRRLYVAAESGVVSVFHVGAGGIVKLGEAFLADNAHSLALDPASHRVYFPLRNVDGRSVLRVMAPK